MPSRASRTVFSGHKHGPRDGRLDVHKAVLDVHTAVLLGRSRRRPLEGSFVRRAWMQLALRTAASSARRASRPLPTVHRHKIP
mmetsp:Transcript_29787/g.102599  ORF Transcript_29787/g.102599 Transcript_29787/m.102599 type:complete len:83 (+) Transcript_29787:546-794(+)